MSNLSQNGGTVYFRQNNSDVQYSTNQTTWNTVSTFPITITNINPVSGNMLMVLFTTELTLSTVSHYFICGSAYITFDGQNNTCLINNVANYPGLIQNGSEASNGKNYITVQNINSDTLGSSTLANDGGWIGCSFFGISANNVLITNCTSTGDISGSAGGICGSYAGYSGSVTVSDCTSSGAISGSQAGGICGYGTGSSGSVTVSNCTSSGAISGSRAGGICGVDAGVYGSVSVINCTSSGAISGSGAGGICADRAGRLGSATISNCYSSGTISGFNVGGICGFFAGYDGSANMYNCYSSGAISGQNAGGICGAYAGLRDRRPNGYASVSNCYSSGILTGLNAGGIYGANKSNTATSTNTYIANGNWSSTDANQQLTGNPSASNPGDVWAYYIVDTPYILTVFYVAPPTTTTINGIIYIAVDLSNVNVSGFTEDISANSIVESSVTINETTYTVSLIGDNAFESCYALNSIILPNTIISIGTSAFQSCSGLSSITLPSVITSIGNEAFANCSNLIEVVIEEPSNIITVNTNSFTDVSNNQDSSITFTNTESFNDLSSTFQTIAYYYANILPSPIIPPTLTDFSFNTQTYGVAPFTIQDPSSNSDGSFSYTSNNDTVAVIIDVNVINIVGVGIAMITATQAAYGDYSEGSIDASLNVIQSTPIHPAELSNGSALDYFMETTSDYGNITNTPITLSGPLLAQSSKTITTSDATTIFMSFTE
jgi:hypothetical protein